MRVKIKKGTAHGKISAPASKSMAHRLLISAALSEGVSTVRGVSKCDDVLATLDCLYNLGIRTEVLGDDVKIHGKNFNNIKANNTLWCKESGSTLRFLIPLALLSKNTIVFLGAPSLMARPMDVYAKLAKEKGLNFIADGETIVTRGPLAPGEYELPGNVSSQFISGLLFALPTLDGDSIIKITSSLESRPYIELTMKAISEFGIKTEWIDDYTIKIPGAQKYQPKDVSVEGDFSGAAFPDALNFLGGDVTVDGLSDSSLQGDKVYKTHFESISSGIPMIHIGNCPDLGPILFALAAAKNGAVFDGTKRLKIKESDRASAMAEELRKFGASVSVCDDTVVVYPKEFHAPTEILKGHNDHRIVMSLAIILTLFGGEIDGAEAVKKSYPSFFNDLRRLGIEVVEYGA